MVLFKMATIHKKLILSLHQYISVLNDKTTRLLLYHDISPTSWQPTKVHFSYNITLCLTFTSHLLSTIRQGDTSNQVIDLEASICLSVCTLFDL